jgi:hypothetical protein
MNIDLSDITAAVHAAHGPRASRHQGSNRPRPSIHQRDYLGLSGGGLQPQANSSARASISGGLAGNAVPYRHALFRLSMTLANRIRARPLLARVDPVAFVSEATARYFATVHFRVPSAVIFNSVDTAIFCPLLDLN